MADFAGAPYERMSASLLSEQPMTPAEDRWSPNRAWDQLFTYLESRLSSLKSWRYSWWAYWAVLAQFFIPRRYIWLVVANRMWRGNSLNDSIIDSTGQLAVRTCSSGIWTGLTSPSRPWFKLGIALPWVQLEADGLAWLEDTEKRVYAVMAQSNFYTGMAQAFQDVVVFGTAPVIIYEDFEQVIRLYVPCAGEYYLAVGARFNVTDFYREFTLTVKQIVDMFTLDFCPQQVRNLWAQGGGSIDKEFVICHAIEPNFPINKQAPSGNQALRIVPGHFPYRECYWLKGIKTEKPLSVKGFRLQPFMTARWATTANDAYGRSPCMDAIGDTKQIQTETRRKAEFIEKGVRPPMGANPDLKNEPSSIVPGNVTYTSTEGGKKGFWPLFEPAPQWLPALTEDIKLVAERINHCLFVDLFMAITRMEGVQPRNELELTKRDLERLQELGPFISLFENEFADPAIGRILEIMQKRKLLKPMPDSIKAAGGIKINYVSIMKLAQRASEAVAMKDGFATAGALSSAAKAAGVPDPIRVIDLDKSMRHYLDLNNFPQDCVYTDDDVKKHDEIRAKMQQQAQAPQQAMAAVTAAKTLSETQLGGGNALGALMGGVPGGAPPA